MADQDKILLTNVRLSFPHLFRAKAFNEDQEPTFSASFILDKEADAEQILAVRQLMTKIARDKWGANIPKGIKLCLRDGNEEGKQDVDGYGPGVMFISASSRKKIPVVDRKRVPLEEDSGKPYAGCYVVASVRLWAQDNKWGKRINAQLMAVQFSLEGEAFGEAPVNVDEEFEELADESGGGAATGETSEDQSGAGLL